MLGLRVDEGKQQRPNPKRRHRLSAWTGLLIQAVRCSDTAGSFCLRKSQNLLSIPLAKRVWLQGLTKCFPVLQEGECSVLTLASPFLQGERATPGKGWELVLNAEYFFLLEGSDSGQRVSRRQ